MTQITRKDEPGLLDAYLHYYYVCSDGSVTAAFKSAWPLKRRGIAYISRSSFFNVISCQKRQGIRHAVDYSILLSLLCFFFSLMCFVPLCLIASKLGTIWRGCHFRVCPFCLSVSFHIEMPPKNWG